MADGRARREATPSRARDTVDHPRGNALRGLIYDTVFRPLSTRWYREVLARMPARIHLLDVGIGTGSALLDNAAFVRQKGLTIVGVDIDADYIERARKKVDEAALTPQIEVRLESIYDHVAARPYDAAYFSASFMLLPDPLRCLQHLRGQLAPGGRVYFTQTFQEKRSAFLEKAKPMLHKVTTIHFGQVTYESDFLAVVQQAGLRLDTFETIGRAGTRTYRLAIGHFEPEEAR